MKRRILAVALFTLVAGYLSVSYVVADRLTHAERHPIGRAPQVAAATYDDVALRTTDGLTCGAGSSQFAGTERPS